MEPPLESPLPSRCYGLRRVRARRKGQIFFIMVMDFLKSGQGHSTGVGSAQIELVRSLPMMMEEA
jgi:hypothetical protein